MAGLLPATWRVESITRNRPGNKEAFWELLNVLAGDCAGHVCSPDGCDADRPKLIGCQFFGVPAHRAGRVLLFRDAMTSRTRFLGELHFSSSMALAVGYGRGESYEEPCVVMDTQIEHQDFTVLALYLVPRFVVCEARTIAEGWNGHGSPPTLEHLDVESSQKPIGGYGSCLYTFL